MNWKTREEYYNDLRAMKKNVWADGRLIDDIVTDPATCQVVESEANTYDLLQDPQYDELLKTKSYLTGKDIVRWNGLNLGGAQDLMQLSKMKRMLFDHVGLCMGGVCVGQNLMNVLWATTYDIDKAKGTDYHERLKKWILDVEDKQYKLAGGLTDAKGDRSKAASQQKDPDVNVHIVEKRADGIVVSGIKTMIANAAVCQEIFISPGTGYKEADADYAVAFVVPRDIDGLTIVQTAEGRDSLEGWDHIRFGNTTAYLIFENCFIPNERVFMAGEAEFAGVAVNNFIGNYRACIGGCVSGQADVMAGAAILMARANGLPMKTFKDKLVDMSLISENAFGLGLGAIANGKAHETGVWIADARLGSVNKAIVGKNYAELHRIMQEIAGGIGEVGAFPNYSSCINPVIGPKIMKALQANPEVSAETRARAARLCQWYAAGNAMIAFIHGGGSPDGAKLVVKATTPYEKYVEYASDIAGITEKVIDPVK